MWSAVASGAASLWNVLPGAVKVANDVLHAVYEPTHAFLHKAADLLTIVIK